MINQIISFSIKNKALIGILTLGLIIGGIYSMTRVPIDALPDITNNQVQVITSAPNLGTEDIEKFVTQHIELAMANLPGVQEIRSISRFGLSVVTIVFDEKMGTYLPRQLVNEALTDVRENIPEGFGKPFMAPITTGLGEIYQYTLEVKPGYEDLYDDMKLRTIQDWIVKRQLAMVPGVVEINSFGGRKKQYEVAVNPDKLKSFGLTVLDVYKALEENNMNTGGAYIEKDHQAQFIRGEGLMRSLDDIRNTFVANVNRHPIFIRDIATVRYGSAIRYGAFTKDGKGEAVGGIVLMLKGENSNQVIKNVKERIAEIQKSLPEGVYIQPFLDRSKLIKNTTSTVVENLSIGALIVIFVLVIFLGNARGGLIVASTIPLALLFAFIMMDIFGVWANLMSLGALDFGILVDGAVIIVESMLYYLHKKEFIGLSLTQQKKDELAYDSASKMMNSAFFGQLIILIVFIPILTLQGVEGKMFKPMAMTFSFAILGVMILCLTYIPMMASLFLKAPKTDKKNFGDRVIEKLENLYLFTFDLILKRGFLVIILAIVVMIISIFIFNRLGSEFIPKLDEGDLAIQASLKPGSSLSDMLATTTRLEQILMEKFPDEVSHILSRIGVADIPTDPMPMDVSDIAVILKPKNQWTKAKTKEELINKMREELSVLPGVNFAFSQPIELRFNELLTGVREDVAIKLYGDDLDLLADKAQEIAHLISDIPGVADIKVEPTTGLPQITIKYNRDKLGQYNLSINEINALVQSAFGGATAGYIYEGSRTFDLVVRLSEKYRKDIEDIRNLYISLKNGNQIPLKEVADIQYQDAPMQISRENTNRRIYVGVNVRGRDIKSVVLDIQKKLDSKLKLPPGYYIRYGGTFENLQRATKRLSLVVPLALALIFILVFFAVKSLKQTLIIYFAVPLATIGGIWALYLRSMPFSISAGVGFIVLFGVAVLNGLVLINGLNQLKEREKDLDMHEIVKRGSVRRIRPILLTATTDILGFLPMAISTSAGAEVQRPLATVVIGGMITSTLLTLIVIPILYKFVESPKWNKRPRNSSTATVVVSILLAVALLLPQSLNAQKQIIQLPLEQTINIALDYYPTLKIASIEINKQKALKKSAFDLGATRIYSGKDEINPTAPGVYTQIGIEQGDMDIFAINAKRKLYSTQLNQAKIKQKLSKAELVRDVSLAWFDALYYKQRLEVFKHLDTLYESFLKAAELRYKTQETSEIEFLSAQAKYKEMKLNIQEAVMNYQASLRNLKQYLPDTMNIDIDTSNIYKYVLKKDMLIDSVNSNTILNYYASSVDVAKAKYKTQKAQALPKISLAYKIQTVDGVGGYYGWEVGFSLPLIYFSQVAKNKAAKLDVNISELQYQQKELEVNAVYNLYLNRYITLKQVIDYYEKEALPLANKQIQANAIGYRLGSVDYIQFIRNVEMAADTKLSFLKQQKEFFTTYVMLKYLLDK